MEYVVLLRGINVGGTARVPMAELRAHLGESFGDVRTYIASGNIVLCSDAAADAVAGVVDEVLHRHFVVTRLVTTLALPADAYREVLAQAPEGFGSEPDVYRYDVGFYVGTDREEVAPHLATHPDVDTVELGERAFYHRRVTALASRSRMSKIVSSPVYPRLTIRNWRTTTTLAGMLTS